MMLQLEQLKKEEHHPLYLQLYHVIKEQIEKGQLKEGEKMPSIRNLSYDMQISKTTVQSAYDQLTVEGYLVSRPKSGYFVLAQTPLPAKVKDRKNKKNKGVAPRPAYLFSSDTIDKTTVDTKRWRSLVKEVLSGEDNLISYGDPQGEYALRKELALYSAVSRSVQADPEQIVVGAGISPLLSILCGLLREEGITQVGMDREGFPVAEQVFYDCGVETALLESDREGIQLSEVKKYKLKALLLLPSKAGKETVAMPLNKRLEFLRYSKGHQCYLIEDDYNGELRFLARPIPALKSIDREDRVIYIGSFSKLLLPSVRIGYMILPEQLAKRYRERATNYNQTASKVEQIALAKYLEDGSMQKHLRKLRKVYSQKAGLLTECLKREFSEDTVTLQETALRVVLQVKTKHTPESFTKLAKAKGLEVRNGVFSEKGGELTLLLSFSSVEERRIPMAVILLKKLLQGDETVILQS